MTLPGRLSVRVTIEARTTTRDAAGQPSVVWSPVATVWAEVKNITGREYFAAQATQSELKTEVMIRTRAGITPGMRVVFKGRTYNIEAVLPQERKREMGLICTSGVNDG